jgi:predicted ester cyclase
MSERNKAVVRRMVEEVMNAGRLDVLDELYSPSMASAARRWITPFREAFPDVAMTVVDLVAEDDKVAARFTCSATQRGEWQGQPATGRRFERVDEVYFFRFRDGRIVHAWGLEDNLDRMRQLGFLQASTG